MKTVVSAASTTSTAPAATKADSITPNSIVKLSTGTGGGNINKRPVSLDLKGPLAKKQRTLALESPDIKPLNTPDLEKVLLSCSLPTPQPGMVFPAKVNTVTSEQEEFGKGFEEALNSLHNSKQNTQVVGGTQLNTSVGSNSSSTTSSSVSAPSATVTTANTITTTATTGMSGGSFTYTNLENFPVAIKDEPQNPSTSPPVSPIDMETQEKIKLERKRQRNRVAASKCRKRKLERISKLEDRVKMLKGENTDLGQVVKTLKDHVAQLKQQVIEHIETGCSIPTICNGTTLLQGK